MANQKEITAGFKGKRKPDNPFKTLGRIFSYYKNCRWMFIVAVIAILLYSASTIGASFMMKPLVAVLEETGVVKTEQYARYLSLTIGMAFLYFSGVVTNYLLNYLMLICSTKVLCELRKDMFNRMQRLPIKYFDTHTHGELMSYYTNDIDAIRELLHHSITQLIISCTSLVGVVLMMLIL